MTDPGETLREADRYLAAALAGGSPFDVAVVELLTRRKVLIGEYTHDRPATAVPVGRFGWPYGDLQHRNILWGHSPTSAGPEHIVGVLDWDASRSAPTPKKSRVPRPSGSATTAASSTFRPSPRSSAATAAGRR